VRWSFFLNVPYIVIPIVSAVRFLRQQDSQPDPTDMSLMGLFRSFGSSANIQQWVSPFTAGVSWLGQENVMSWLSRENEDKVVSKLTVKLLLNARSRINAWPPINAGVQRPVF